MRSSIPWHVLGALLIGASAARTSAQDIKPQTSRLPAPATVSASQRSDGRIRVVWSSVDGAIKYRLIRSVPPEPIAPVALPDPSDTQYVDSDVKAGRTYYYEVAALNEAGTVGLKRSAPPVTAAASPPTDSANLRDQEAPVAGADEGVSTPSPTASGCTGSERYRTCTSAMYEATGVDLLKSGTALCPGGYVALGGGYEGLLTGALVQGSRPLTGTAKERAGWIVTVARLIFPASGDLTYQIATTTMSAKPVKFTVFVVCGSDSP